MMKPAKPVILILTTGTGGGHMNLAQSLKGFLEAHYEVVITNPQSPIVSPLYTAISRHFLPFLHWQYRSTDNTLASSILQRLLTAFGRERIQAIIEHIQPKLIITTHAMISYAAARANERLSKRVPLVFQLTDLGQVHMTWFIEKQADAYFAPTREIFMQAKNAGIESNRLHLTGRPIRRQFLEASLHGRNETLTSLGLNPAVFTVFLQGGAMGGASIDRTVEALLSMKLPVQIVLAVGSNKKMLERYAASEQVRALSFTEVIAPYMAAADIIAGKAGASSISEAIMLEKPFLATACIPGQETPNLKFIQQHNLGWVCFDAREQQELCIRLATNPALIAEKMDDICAYKAWNIEANQEICPIIDRLLA